MLHRSGDTVIILLHYFDIRGLQIVNQVDLLRSMTTGRIRNFDIEDSHSRTNANVAIRMKAEESASMF